MLFVPASPLVGNIEQEFDAAKLANSGDSADSARAIKVFGEVNAPAHLLTSQTPHLSMWSCALAVLLATRALSKFA